MFIIQVIISTRVKVYYCLTKTTTKQTYFNYTFHIHICIIVFIPLFTSFITFLSESVYMYNRTEQNRAYTLFLTWAQHPSPQQS